MTYLEKKVYLIITFIALVLGILSHYMVDSVNDFKAVLLYYLPFFFLLIPSLLFFREIKLEIKESKPLSMLFFGYFIGIFFISFIAIYRLIGLGNINDLISPTLLYVIRVIVIGLVITGGVWNFIISSQKTTRKLYYVIIGVSFSFFMLSSLAGFYVYNQVVGFNAPFLRLDMIFSYLFQDFIYFFALIGFPISAFAKYQLLDWNKRRFFFRA